MSSRARVLDLVLGALLASQLVLAAWLVPAGDQVVTASGGSLGTMCLTRALFGVSCPFCGMMRSFVALAHGHIAAAFAFHPAGPLLFAAMLACVVAIAVVTVRRARPLVARDRFWRIFQAVAYACIAIGTLNLVGR